MKFSHAKVLITNVQRNVGWVETSAEYAWIEHTNISHSSRDMTWNFAIIFGMIKLKRGGCGAG